MRILRFCQVDKRKYSVNKNSSMRTLSMKEIQGLLFDMLCVLADYCDTHEIQYYLISGTLLGAIRHKDFIPWDDEADILIPRPDYMRLLELLSKEPIRAPYEICSNEFGTLLFPFSKLLDRRTGIAHSGVTPALWIDIFPMDGLPNDEQECMIFLEQAKRLKDWYWRARRGFCTAKTPLRTIYRILLICYAKIRGVDHWIAKQDQLAKTYDFEKSAYVGGVCYSMGPCERMEKKEFLPQTEVEFHGRMFHAPGCWDKYLTAMYGNYMEPTPENERKTNRFFIWNDKTTE